MRSPSKLGRSEAAAYLPVLRSHGDGSPVSLQYTTLNDVRILLVLRGLRSFVAGPGGVYMLAV
jgi:hypothetical protein